MTPPPMSVYQEFRRILILRYSLWEKTEVHSKGATPVRILQREYFQYWGTLMSEGTGSSEAIYCLNEQASF